jgi:hypothetical protein
VEGYWKLYSRCVQRCGTSKRKDKGRQELPAVNQVAFCRASMCSQLLKQIFYCCGYFRHVNPCLPAPLPFIIARSWRTVKQHGILIACKDVQLPRQSLYTVKLCCHTLSSLMNWFQTTLPSLSSSHLYTSALLSKCASLGILFCGLKSELFKHVEKRNRCGN